MKKIPTVFVRDPENRKLVLDEVNPGCEWIMAGEGVATRKHDGTCCMFDGERWWARREVKPGKHDPDGWVEIDHDDVTGKRVGWEPIEQSGFAKFHAEALERDWQQVNGEFLPGTYELCGPKVNGNPEQILHHSLVPHGCVKWATPIRTFDGLRAFMEDIGQSGYEGVVWHHPDGRMAKLKVRDFPTEANS